MDKKESRISNTEWGLFIGALAMIDGLQVLLEWLSLSLTSITINPLIDLFVTMTIPFYLYMRGEKMADSKKIVGLAGILFGELIPGLDELPLWCLYGVYLFVLSKSNKVLEHVPTINPVKNTIRSIKQRNVPNPPNLPKKQSGSGNMKKAA